MESNCVWVFSENIKKLGRTIIQVVKIILWQFLKKMKCLACLYKAEDVLSITGNFF